MNTDFTPKRPDFTGGVKSKTHRLQRAFYTFYGFYGFSLEGYAWAHARTHDLPLEICRKIRKIRKIGLPSCGGNFTPAGMWRKIGCKIGVIGA